MLCWLIGFPVISHSRLMNGDFSNGLNGWTTEENVMINSNMAVLGDTFSDLFSLSSTLYQSVALTPGQYEYSFDFKNQLSAVIPTNDPFDFFDMAFFRLYFSNDATSMATSLPESFVTLFYLDALSPFFVNPDIALTSQGDWIHVSYIFNNQLAYVMPAFGIYGLNSIFGDSQLLIDNVSLSRIDPYMTIPTPDIIWLILIGLGLLRARQIFLFCVKWPASLAKQVFSVTGKTCRHCAV